MRTLLSLIPFLHACVAVKVYLSPQTSVPSQLAPQRASLTLAHHLGLEAFESLDSANAAAFRQEVPFVGQGQKSGLILSVDEQDIEHIAPSSLKPSFTVTNSPEVDSFSSVISNYLGRAEHAYSTIYSTSSFPTDAASRHVDLFDMLPSHPEVELFYTELSALSSLLDSVDGSTAFAAIELAGLSQIRSTFGADSQEYQLAAAASRAAIESALTQSKKLHFAMLTFDPMVTKRQHEQLLQTQAPLPIPTPQPIGSISSCFGTMDACTNGTSSCTGRGRCTETSRAGKTCFVCACGTTKTEKGSTDTWVGEKCEKKDVSAPFTLLAGTTIVIILIIVGSVALLASAGGQELPSVLMGGVVNVKRD